MPSTSPKAITSPHPRLDPSAPGTIIQYALAIESIFSIGFGAFLIFSPSTSVNFVAASPKLITPLSSSIVQIIGGLVSGLSVPMILAVPSTRRGIELRAPIYYCLGAMEVFLVGFFGYAALNKGEAETGLSSKASMTLMWNTVVPLGLRAYALFVKPLWFGRYDDGSTGRKGE